MHGRLVHGRLVLASLWLGPVILVGIQRLACAAVAEALPDSQQLKHQALVHRPLRSFRILPAPATTLASAGVRFWTLEAC